MWNLKEKTELIDTENRLVVVRSKGWGDHQKGEGGQQLQTFSYKINKSWGYNVQHGTIINSIVYLKATIRVHLKSSHHKKKLTSQEKNYIW